MLDYNGSEAFQILLRPASPADMRRRITVLTMPATHPDQDNPSHDHAALHGEALDLVAQGADLGVEVGSLVGGEGNGDDRPGDTARTALVDC